MNTQSPQTDTAITLHTRYVVLASILLILICLLIWFFLRPPQVSIAPAITPERPTATENNEPESITAKAALRTTQTLSPSDELNAIEADITGTTFIDLEAALAAINTTIAQ